MPIKRHHVRLRLGASTLVFSFLVLTAACEDQSPLAPMNSPPQPAQLSLSSTTLTGEAARDAAISSLESIISGYEKSSARNESLRRLLARPLGELRTELTSLRAARRPNALGALGIESEGSGVSVTGGVGLGYGGTNDYKSGGMWILYYFMATSSSQTAHLRHKAEIWVDQMLPATASGAAYNTFMHTEGSTGTSINCDQRSDAIAYSWHTAKIGEAVEATTDEFADHCGPEGGQYGDWWDDDDVDWGDDGDHSYQESSLDGEICAAITESGWYDVYVDGVYRDTIWCEG